jgi:tetratricopeptide (TPR) repeat protein
MKSAAILLTVLCVVGNANSQQISGSKFEGKYEKLEICHLFEASGAQHIKYHALLLFDTEAAVDAFGGIAIPDVERAVVSFLGIRVISAQGTREIPANQLGPWRIKREGIRFYPVPGLKKQDRLEYDVTMDLSTTNKGIFWFSGKPTIDLPVVEGSWELVAPSSTKLAVQRTEGHKKTDQGSEFWDLKGVTPASTDNTEPWVVMTSFQDWRDLGSWMIGRQGHPAITPSIRTEALQITKATTDPKDHAKAIYNFLAKSIRLVDIPLGNRGYEAQLPERTLLLHQGDRLSKHILFLALLKAAGLEAQTAYTKAEGDLALSPPSPAEFDEVFAVIREGKNDVWASASLNGTPFGLLPKEYRGKNALLAASNNSALVKTPIQPALTNQIQVKWAGNLDKDGNLTGKVRIEAQGDAAIELNKHLSESGDSANAGLGLIAPPLARALSSQPAVTVDSDDSSVAEIEIHEDGFVEPLLRRSAIHLRALQLASMDVPNKRCNLMDIAVPFNVTEEFELRMPSGFRAVLLPPTTREQSLSDSYRSEISYDSNKLTVKRLLARESADLQDKKIEEALSSCRIYADTVRTFTIERIGETDLSAALANRTSDELHQKGFEAIQAGKFELARILMQEVVRQDPSHKFAWNNLGRVLVSLGRLDEAETAYRKQIEVNPRDQYAWNNLGLIQIQQGRLEEAIGSFREQLKFSPQDQYANRNLAHAFMELGRVSEAEPYIRTALTINQQDQQTQIEAAVAHICHGGIADAYPELEAVLKRDTSPNTHNGIAWLLAQCGTDLGYALSQAEIAEMQVRTVLKTQLRNINTDWKQCLTLQTLLAAVYDTKAWVLYKLGRYSESENLLEEASRLNPHFTEFKHLYEVRLRMGRVSEAAEAWVNAQVSRGQNSESKPEAFDQLPSLPKPKTDSNGWAPVPGFSGTPPPKQVGETPKLAYILFVCLVDEAGLVQDAFVLDGVEAWASQGLADLKKTRIPTGQPQIAIKNVRLVRIEYHADGDAKATYSSSDRALREAMILAPEKRPDELLITNTNP